MVKDKIIKFCYKAVEWHMLKIYATVMTTIFLGIWLTAMVAVVQEIYQTFFRSW
jgi:hypothetical protein